MPNLELIKSSASRYLGRGVYHLIELRHSNFTQDWNFVNAGLNSDITIDGTTYQSLPFAYTLSPQGEDAGASMVIANVDRRIADELSLAMNNEDILVNTYLAHIEKDSLNIQGERYFKGTFSVTGAEVTQDAVSLGLSLRTSLGFNLSSLRYSQNNFGNLYL